MIRLLLSVRQTFENTTPDWPERVPCQPGDVIVQRRDGAFHVFRYEPGVDETAELVFSSFDAALAAARDSERHGAPLGTARAPSSGQSTSTGRVSAEVIELRRLAPTSRVLRLFPPRAGGEP